MEKKIIFLVVLVALLALPEFISSEVIKRDIPYKKRKFPYKSECLKACAAAFTGGDESRIQEGKPGFFKCTCYYTTG
uniref:Omega-scoloptoxin(15)-Ssd3c n=1 Tax=Scolopendra dehaani TaxID=2609776 RepID=TXF3C_SCODE|nr:RecName: Full=Omega-scoloptoxin(15)-Ssd3c; Short=Omega-SLPTX(15)-Ssd3c; AltName: Full=Toxin SSD1052; Flags: Precursor [Scolopendra dehaani]